MASAPLKSPLLESTEGFYERNATRYAESTLHVDMSGLYSHFLRYLPEHARILDAGSGSGRDTLAFQQLGYSVDAFDASNALCLFSSHLTGRKTRHLQFQEFSSPPIYDGIWACASLLHVQKSELQNCVQRLLQALQSGGVMYISFKYGMGERVSADGRYYFDMDEHKLRRLIDTFADVSIQELWRWTPQQDIGDADEWLNVIVRKDGSA